MEKDNKREDIENLRSELQKSGENLRLLLEHASMDRAQRYDFRNHNNIPREVYEAT